MTDEAIYDARTRCEKHAAAIANLESQAALLAACVDAHYAQLVELRARVAVLEAKPAPPTTYTASLHQSYTWLPGDAWSQYTAATDGEQPAYTISISPVRDDALDDDLDDGPDPFEDC